MKRTPFIIGISGGSCVGKGEISKRMINHFQKRMGDEHVLLLSQDRYYKGGNAESNYDVPDALNLDHLYSDIVQLKQGKSIDAPLYDFSTHSVKKETERLESASVIIVEGILIFCNEALRSIFDLKIFVDADTDVMLARRIMRDISERGRTVEEVIKRYTEHVKPSYKQYIKPCKDLCDHIIRNNGNDKSALDNLFFYYNL